MTAEQVTTEPIEVRYTPTQDDLAEGFAARRRGWRVVVLAVTVLLALAVGFLRSGAWDLPTDSAAVVVAVLLAVGLGLLANRFLLRGIHRWRARLVLRGNPRLSQPVRAGVSDLGVSADNATGASMSSWSLYPLYVERKRSFVLLASAGLTAMPLVLPKRALPEDDIARLRTVLDLHSQRRG